MLLADDERGRIAYTPRFVDAAIAAAWFAELRSGVKWRAERRMMYDREVDVPRLMSTSDSIQHPASRLRRSWTLPGA